MFAAVNGNVIHLYSTTTFDNILNLKGHSGKVSAARVSPVSMSNNKVSVKTFFSKILPRLRDVMVLNNKPRTANICSV